MQTVSHPQPAPHDPFSVPIFCRLSIKVRFWPGTTSTDSRIEGSQKLWSTSADVSMRRAERSSGRCNTLATFTPCLG